MAEYQGKTYNYVCFSELAYESDFSDKKEIEKKIRRRLKYYKLSEYSQERVDYIRALKNDLYKEISSRAESSYFKKTESIYAEYDDFNIEKMIADYGRKYDRVDEKDMTAILGFAVYLFHTR
jgi:regulator of sigma D